MDLSPIEQTLASLIRPTLAESGEALSSHEPTLSAFDWRLISKQAIEHRLAPLLHRVLLPMPWQTQVPEDVTTALRFEFMKANVTNLMVYRQLGLVLNRFEQESIPVVLLKGGALARVLYSDMALRPMSDLDVLVPQSDFPRACELMTEDGYKPFLEPEAGFQRDYCSVVGFDSPHRGHVPIEVHRHLFHIPYYSRRIPMEWFWERTEPIDFEGCPVLVFSPTAQTLHLASHLVLGHQDNGLRWLYDIALLLRRHGERIDWKELADAATAFELRPVLQMALNDVAQIWKVTLPSAEDIYVTQLKPSLGERWVVAANTAHYVDAEEVWNVANLEGWRKRLGYLRQTLFPGSTYMRERYGVVNERLVPAYYLWRLGKGLYLLLRSSFSIGLNFIKHLSDSKQTR